MTKSQIINILVVSMRTESLIRAKYKGTSNKYFTQNEKYLLATWFSKRLFGDSYLVVKRLGFESSKYPYKTLKLFLSDWEIFNDER